MTKEGILSFEEFTQRDDTGHPIHNNFFLHWIPGFSGNFYRAHEFYQRFSKDYADLDRRLREAIENRDISQGTIKSLEPHEGDLYQAYEKMKKYGAEDSDLFR